MRKIYLVLMIWIFGTSGLLAQVSDQEAQILQLCIDLPEIQEFYPQFDDESKAAVYIMQYPIAISTDLPLQKFNKQPVYMSRHEIYDNNVDAYFLFKQIDVGSQSAFVEYTMYYDYNSDDQKIVNISLDFQKSDAGWAVQNTQLEHK
ncbi:hypothetical protein [Sunxiuqinia dokdonensis]|nr:hypothetical protein [Sunxiuqinia dokdonensis]